MKLSVFKNMIEGNIRIPLKINKLFREFSYIFFD